MRQGWTSACLGDLFEIARGGSPRPIDDYLTDDPAGIPWIMIGDASPEVKYISSTKKRILRKGARRSRMVKPGDFILTNSMSFGRPYIVGIAGCIHDGWLVLSPKRSDIDTTFFYHLLGSKALYAEFERRAAGATVKNLNSELVRGIEVAVPPFLEQRRIAEVLDQAGMLLEKRRRALTGLDVLAEALFVEMFGDPVENPLRWPQRTGESVCTRLTVGVVVKPASYYREQGVPALRSLNIKPGRILIGDVVYFSPEDNQTKLAKSRLREGDVVVVRTGQPGTAAVVPAELDGANAIDIIVTTPDTSQILPDYLCAFLNSDGGKRVVLAAQRGQVQKHFNVAALKSATIPVPALSRQRDFSTRLAAAETLRRQLSCSLTQMDDMLASLHERAFAGEL